MSWAIVYITGVPVDATVYCWDFSTWRHLSAAAWAMGRHDLRFELRVPDDFPAQEARGHPCDNLPQ